MSGYEFSRQGRAFREWEQHKDTVGDSGLVEPPHGERQRQENLTARCC